MLIVPTSLMGAALPLVVRSALGCPDAAGSRIGLFYAVNTAGAIGGALVAGSYVISEVGVSASFRLAAAVNTLVGVTAILASRATSLAPAAFASAHPSRQGAPDGISGASDGHDGGPIPRRLVLWGFALSGLMSLAVEVIWFRILVVVLRPNAYAFTVMLAALLSRDVVLGADYFTHISVRLP